MTRGYIPIELGDSWLTTKPMAVGSLCYVPAQRAPRASRAGGDHSVEYSNGVILTSESSSDKVHIMIQAMEAKLDSQERNNSIYRLKFLNRN